MKFSKSLKKSEKELYILICESIWGCIPIDVDWAINTKIYQEYLNTIKKSIYEQKKDKSYK